MEKDKEKFKEFEDIEELREAAKEGEKEEPIWKQAAKRTIIGVLSLLVILGLIYLSGIRLFFFYQKTPENVEAKKMESILAAKTMRVPVYARVIQTEGSA